LRRWAAVCGKPIAHSLSPVLHRAAYRALGLDWSYEARECGADGLAALLAGARDDPSWAGFSLTMPLKTPVLALLDEVDPLAAAVGAVNTVVPAGPAGPAEPAGLAGPVRLVGFNTDVAGMQAALAEAGLRKAGPTVILGAGGTAQAALAALAGLGQRNPVVALRDRARAGALLDAAHRLGVTPGVVAWPALDALLQADLVISTVPAGAADGLAHEMARLSGPRAQVDEPGAAGGGRSGPAGTRGGWPARTCLFDVVYSPWPTELAAVAGASGAVVIGGLDLLVHQAVRQVELMTGRMVAASVLRAAGQAATRHR
jgi:shikimate dehydrogenase